jgi:hypothetical protein
LKPIKLSVICSRHLQRCDMIHPRIRLFPFLSRFSSLHCYTIINIKSHSWYCYQCPPSGFWH